MVMVLVMVVVDPGLEELVDAGLWVVVTTELALVLTGLGLVELMEAERSVVMTTELALVLTDLGLLELVEAELSVVMTTELALALTDLGLVELVEAELSLVVSTELALVLTGFGLVELVEAELSLVTMVSLSTTVAFNSVPSTPSLTSVCSTSTSVVGAAVSRKVESPGPGAGDVAGVTVSRKVESPGALLSTCFFLGNTKVPSNCERALDNLDWSKYEPVKWALAMTMRMTAFISATC